jgi:hypothetical protein
VQCLCRIGSNIASLIKKRLVSKKIPLVLLFISLHAILYSQVSQPTDSVKPLHRIENHANQYDFGDLEDAVFKPHKKPDSLRNRSGIIVVPNIAANPTIGFQGGVKAVAGKKLGNDPKTLFSIAATSASITTKGIIYFYLNHNIFTSGNKLNLQGNLVISKSLAPDHGLGIGKTFNGNGIDSVLADPTGKVYPIHSVYFNFREKVYKKVAPNLFIGAGLSFEIRRNITNNDSSGTTTPSGVYNEEHAFPQSRYSANGFLFNVEYITRDNPNRAYKGIYFDAGVRANQTWIGSTKNSVQFTSDFRKYFSLSNASPETVLAFWNWGSYLFSGTIPYLELPGTARDGTFRSGRGYTTQYFKGTKFNDTELELRFPILANKFVSGVIFGNLQTGNDEHGTALFQVFQPGYGAGFRILFNKTTRTNLCLDYAFGKFGNKGFFLNLNEAF